MFGCRFKLNLATLLDAKGGVSIKLPLIFIPKVQGSEPCARQFLYSYEIVIFPLLVLGMSSWLEGYWNLSSFIFGSVSILFIYSI